MSKYAAKLRDIAYDIEKELSNAPQSAQQVIKEAGIEEHRLRNEASLEMLGRNGYDVLAHLRNQAAHQLANHIAKSMEFEPDDYSRGGYGYDPLRRTKTYEATVIVLSPAKLKQVVERAYCLGRNR